MKIAMLCCSNAWGGLEINIFKLCCWLQERGNNVLLIASEDSKIAQKAKEANIRIEYLNLSKSKFLHFVSVFGLIKTLKKHQIHNLIIGHYRQYYLAVWAKSLGFTIKIKLLYLQQMRMNVNRKNPYHAYYFSRIDAWLTPLKYLKDELIVNTTLKEGQIHLHPLCCDTKKFTNANAIRSEARKTFRLNENIFLVGIAGRLDKEKGQKYLIEAIKLLKDRNIIISALIVGEESVGGTGYLAELKQTTSSLGVENLIIFKPFTDEIAAFYKAIDIFAICSTNEPFGMVTVEAMLSGTPIVGAETGGTSEILNGGQWGNLFEAKNAKSLAKQLETMYLKYPEAVEKAAQFKEDATSKYSHNTWCERIENIFNNL